MAMTAKDIIDKLRVKHSKDVFVEECETGPSYGGYSRFDAWAMNRSWANHCCTGYEIKVSRGDFMNDNKTQNYLPFCHELYFVCPWKMIDPSEVPDYAGLMWAAPNSSRVIRKKKAPKRVDVDPIIFIYVLMCRSVILRESDIVTGGQREFWQRWLQQKKADTELSYHVSRRIREAFREQVEKVEREKAELANKIKNMESAAVKLKEAGFDLESLSWWEVRNKIAELEQIVNKAIPEEVISQIENSIRQLNCARDGLLELKNQKVNDEAEAGQ